ncbi:Outer membrane cobalamin receptor protein [Sphingobacterium spiritivorum]|uniref:Outer membrane cobalamin receptor protein n=1 Tax=Sphingobacterium spiritivorum TaxID=258 RepID=A0A380CPA6_SPHSI|nr:TonB-dependent receptor [Sphingobacterium spiritivorum]SUJ24110.1 Outer membrane cobalamin receptor protein [Sphingobacterium spiritivorum]
MRNFFTYFLLVFSLALSTPLFGQQISISGTVKDSGTGIGIAGVTIAIKGGTTAVQSNDEGLFTIQAKPTDVLQLRYIGYVTQDVPVNNQTTLNIALVSDSEALEEVVVIGYGTAAKRDLTGSIASVSGKDVADKPSPNPISSIQGKVAGVQITNSGEPGGAPNVKIRGTNSINGASPLYVVDGILNDNINFLNPSDIESMEILKDPSSLAIFGVRGANGVIIISTKSAKQGDLNFNFNSTLGFKDVNHRMKMTDAEEFKTLYNEQLKNEGATPFDYTNWNANTDWQDQIFQRGILNYNNLSVSGATDKNKFYMGLGYTTEEGVVKHEEYKKLTLNINDELKITDNFKVGMNFSGYKASLPQIQSGLINTAIIASPVTPVFNDEYGLYHNTPPFQTPQIYSPMVGLELRKNTRISDEYRAVGSVFAELTFLEHFTAKASFLYDYGFNGIRSYTPIVNVYDPNIQGTDKTSTLVRTTSVSQEQNTYKKAQSDWLLTYKNNWGDHSLTATAGFTTYYRGYEGIITNVGQGSGDPIPNDPRFFYTTMGDQTTRSIGGSQWERATLSYLVRGLYNYKGKYLLNGSFRRDGSSAFLGSNRWQNSGAIGAGWVVSEESFMQDQQLFDNLKIKGSWGVLGNENTGDGYRYPVYPTLVSGSSTSFGDNIYPALSPAYSPDPNLRWESVHSWEAGFEAKMLKNRLSLEAVYYDKKTKDILVEVPGVNGFLPILRNAGEIQNKGFEFSAGWNQQLTEDLKLGVNANLTTLKNKVLNLVNDDFAILAGNGVSRTMSGQPVGYFYGLKTDGVYQNQAEVDAGPKSGLGAAFKPGDIKYVDINNDGTINTQDRTIIGNPTPDFIYGFSVNLSYKNFDFGTEFMGVSGNELIRTWNRNQYSTFNFLEDRLGRWTGEGTSNFEPIMDSKRTNNREFSSYFIEDGSFFRIRNIQLGYNFKREALEKIKLKSLRLFLNAQNPFTFSKNTGYTPEIGGSAIAVGVDNGTYPIPAIYTVGVNVNF